MRLDIKGKDINRFRDSLDKKNIHLHEPVENGFFLKINPTINRIQPEALAQLFLDSLKSEDKNRSYGGLVLWRGDEFIFNFLFAISSCSG